MLPIRPKRPVGITLLAISFLWIACCGGISLAVFAFTGGLFPLWQSMITIDAHAASWPKALQYSVLVIWYLFYPAYALIGFGLWKMRNWARQVTLGILIFFVLLSLLLAPLLVRPEVQAAAILLGVISPSVWIVWYLERPRVRFVFRPEQRAELPPRLSNIGRLCIVIAIAANLAVYVALNAIAVVNVANAR